MNKGVIDTVNRLMAPVWQRIALMVARALIREVQEEGRGPRRLKLSVMAGEELEGTELVQHYGLASRPLDGCEAVAIFAGGQRAHGYVIATDDPRFKPLGLEPGEVVIYGQGDALGEGEEIPEPPEGAPAGWPTAPETEEDAPAPLCRISLLGRRVRITCQDYEVHALGTATIAAAGGLSLLTNGPLQIGPFVAPESYLGEEGHRVARVGDCVDVQWGSSEGLHPIVEGGDCG